MACRALLRRFLPHRHSLAAASTFIQHVRCLCDNTEPQCLAMPRPILPGDGTPRAVTLIPGDGIGPLVTDAVEQVMKAMNAPIYFEKFNNVRGDMERLPEEVVDSIRKNKVCLKGPLFSSSLNTQLKKELDVFASVVSCANLLHLRISPITVISESTEPGDEESFKICSERIERYAFYYAYFNMMIENFVTLHDKAGRGRWTVDEILELLKSRHPDPRFNVLVTPYFYKDLVTNAVADRNGVASIITEVNVGDDHAIFEQGALAGSNKWDCEKLVAEKKANPMGLLLTSSLLLRHLHFHTFSLLLESAVYDANDRLLKKYDLGDVSTTQEVVDEVTSFLEQYSNDRFSHSISVRGDW